jgi:YihY family inner membrane protein
VEPLEGSQWSAARRIGVWRVLRRAAAEARNDDVATAAQALAYALFLAIPAGLLVVLGVFSLLADEQTADRLITRLQGLMPQEVTTLLEDSLRRSIQSTRGGVVLTAVGLGLAVWTTTSAATTLMKALTKAYDAEETRSFVRKRGLALVIVTCLVGAAGLVFGFLVLGPYTERWVGSTVGAPSAVAWLWWVGQWPILVAALLFAFAVLLHVGPDLEQPRWNLVTPGAAVSVTAWLVASGCFSLYAAGFGSYEKTWGTLSAVILTLVWLWLTSAAILFGAEVNAEILRAMQVLSSYDAATDPGSEVGVSSRAVPAARRCSRETGPPTPNGRGREPARRPRPAGAPPPL